MTGQSPASDVKVRRMSSPMSGSEGHGVLGEAVHAEGRGGRVPPRPEQLAVLATVAQLAPPLAPLGDLLPQVDVGLGGRPPRLEDARVPTDRLGSRVPGHLLEAGVHVLDIPRSVGDHDRDRALLDGTGQAAKLVLDVLALGDVQRQPLDARSPVAPCDSRASIEEPSPAPGRVLDAVLDLDGACGSQRDDAIDGRKVIRVDRIVPSVGCCRSCCAV